MRPALPALLFTFVSLGWAGSPDFMLLTDMIPDRRLTNFEVDARLRCGNWNRSLPFLATVWLYESNIWIDEQISRPVYVDQNAKEPMNVELTGRLFTVQEFGSYFEPYIYFKYRCLGFPEKKGRFWLDPCPKEEVNLSGYCDYDVKIDLMSLD